MKVVFYVKENSKISNFLYLCKVYLKYGKSWFIVVSLSTLFVPIQAYIGVVLLRDTVNAATAGESLNSIIIRVAILTSVYLLTTILDNIIEIYIGEEVNVRISNGINKDIYIKTLQTDFKYFDNPEFYDNYTWTLRSFYNQTFSAVRVVWRFITVVLTLGTLLSLIAMMNYVVIFFSLISVLLTMLINLKSNEVIYKKEEQSLPHRRKLDYVQRVFYLKEFAQGIKSTKMKDVFLKKYDESTNELSNVVKKYRTRVTILSFLSYAFYSVVRSLVLIYLCYAALTNRINIGELAALYYASESLTGHLNGFLDLITQTKRLDLYTEKTRAFFELESTIETFDPEEAIRVNSDAFSVRLENVSFKYRDDNGYVLRNINLDINPYQKIAIVGKNGAGKSTLAKLLLRLYDSTEGTIYINGHQIKSINLDDLRNNVGIAFQENQVYAMSVKENIAVYQPYMEEQVIEDVANKLNLESILKKYNATLHAQVTREFDEHGIELSGGERQLIALARIFAKPFGLIILDEPSSSLDPLMEYELNKIIMRKTKNSTVIIVSHRLSTVRDADLIYLLSNGEIRESGTHDQLISLKGEYYEMFTKQAENYISKEVV